MLENKKYNTVSNSDVKKKGKVQREKKKENKEHRAKEI